MERIPPATAAIDDPKFLRLVERLRSLGSVVVAYSGGVDSTFLLKVAHDVLGERARGVLARSESLDRNEYEAAVELARRLGILIDVIETREYENPLYRRNDPNRCYHCKKELFVELRKYASREGFAWVADGSHAGDVGDHRPGLRARDEEGVRSPLLEAGLTKEEIREFSRRLGLPTWDKPAAPCLASRIPYGTEVSWDKLRQIERAEKGLRELGFSVCRVRHHGDVARIEVPAERLPDLLRPEIRERALEVVKEAGFMFVTVDLEGFRSGSLNRVLSASPAGLVQVERLGGGAEAR